MNSDCIFCQIINKSIPSEFFFEDENFIAIFDIHPKVKNHLLIIPKSHFGKLSDADEIFQTKIVSTINHIVQKLMLAYEFVDFRLELNDGKRAGQEIPHLHFHLLPYT